MGSWGIPPSGPEILETLGLGIRTQAEKEFEVGVDRVYFVGTHLVASHLGEVLAAWRSLEGHRDLGWCTPLSLLHWDGHSRPGLLSLLSSPWLRSLLRPPPPLPATPAASLTEGPCAHS